MVQAIRDPEWRTEVDSDDGGALEELAELGWVELEVEGTNYVHTVTKRGLERHALWGDERRLSPRKSGETEFRAAS